MSFPIAPGHIVLVETVDGLFDVVKVTKVLGTDLTEDEAIALLATNDAAEIKKDEEDAKCQA